MEDNNMDLDNMLNDIQETNNVEVKQEIKNDFIEKPIIKKVKKDINSLSYSGLNDLYVKKEKSQIAKKKQIEKLIMEVDKLEIEMKEITPLLIQALQKKI